MNINDYLAAYLVTNDEKVLNNIQNFIDIAVAKANKRIRGAFFEVIATSPTLPPDLVAIKWLTVNGELYGPSLVANEATYNLAAGRLSITPALTGADALEFCYYQVNAAVMATATPAVLIHGAAAEALMFQGNQDGALAETALFQKDLDDCLGWEQHGTISQGRGNAAGAPVSPATPPLPYLSSDTPPMDGAGTPGASVQGARGDHQHPENYDPTFNSANIGQLDVSANLNVAGVIYQGNPAPVPGLTLLGMSLSTDTAAGTNLQISKSCDAANPPQLHFIKQRGSTDAPAGVLNADGIGNIPFLGYDGLGGWPRAALISVAVDGTPGALILPGSMTLSTTNAAGTSVEGMKITAGQVVTLGGNAATPALKINPANGQNRNVTINGSNGGNPTIGTSAGNLALSANGALSLRVEVPAGTDTNFTRIISGPTGTPVYVAADGSVDSNVNIVLTSKGTGQIALSTNLGATPQVVINNTGAATRYITLTGAIAGGNPTIGTSAGDLSVTPRLRCDALVVANNGTATPAGGDNTCGLYVGSAGIGVFIGSGVPTIAATKGSLYLRSDGSGVGDRMYVAKDAVGNWAAVTTAS
jgi:hypothetical protein